MGQAKRRRGIQAMRDGFKEMHAEGQGIWDIKIYGPLGMMQIASAALAGDDDAGRVILLLERLTLDIVEAGRTRKPLMCLLCENTFGQPSTMPMAWVVLHAHVDNARQGFGNGICWDCWERYPSADALAPVVLDYYRSKVISDLRVLPQPIEPGHA